MFFRSKGIHILALFLFTYGVVKGQLRYDYRHQQMGTQIRLVFYAVNQETADRISKKVFERIDQLNTELSDYLNDSELNSLCRNSRKTYQVSSDLYKVLRKSVEVSQKTNGSFDVTSGPLIQLWRKSLKNSKLPSLSALKKVKKNIGYQYITFPEKNTVRLTNQGMLLDLGGIAKGYAADEALKILESHGIFSSLIDMGGDIRVGDPPSGKDYWTLAFTYYDADDNEMIRRIKLKNQAVATSGDVYQYVDIDGIRYSHIIDPKSGMALNNGIQVTVIAPTGIEADAYASAFSVLGIKGTKEALKTFDSLSVFLVETDANGYHKWQSPTFERFENR